MAQCDTVPSRDAVATTAIPLPTREQPKELYTRILRARLRRRCTTAPLACAILASSFAS